MTSSLNVPAECANIGEIKQRIQNITAAIPAYTSVVSVSKQQPDFKIDAALAAGITVFGENKLQEAQERWEGRRAAHPNLELHFVGQLQSRKVGKVVEMFDYIHSIDRESVVVACARALEKSSKTPKLFIQINTGHESQKGGVAPRDLPNLMDLCHENGLCIHGLMAVPPNNQPAAPHFHLLNKLVRRHNLPLMSIGMSGDFNVATAFGATHIRLGTAIFGPRLTR